MFKISNNFECWITKDGEHFAVHNTASNSVDGGYKLGEYAEFNEAGNTYQVTIDKSGTCHSQIKPNK